MNKLIALEERSITDMLQAGKMVNDMITQEQAKQKAAADTANVLLNEQRMAAQLARDTEKKLRYTALYGEATKTDTPPSFVATKNRFEVKYDETRNRFILSHPIKDTPMFNVQDEYTDDNIMWETERQRVVEEITKHNTHRPVVYAGADLRQYKRVEKLWQLEHNKLTARYDQANNALITIDLQRELCSLEKQISVTDNRMKLLATDAKSMRKRATALRTKLAKLV